MTDQPTGPAGDAAGTEPPEALEVDHVVTGPPVDGMPPAYDERGPLDLDPEEPAGDAGAQRGDQ